MDRGTKDLILDAAEALFSKKGVEGVSLRALTGEAGVNLAAVHYHFGSKERVVKAVFGRRIRPVNRMRIQMLDAVQQRGSASVEEVLTALIGPVLQLAGDSTHKKRFMMLCARLYTEPAEYLQRLFAEEFAEVIERFEQAFCAALPSLPAAVVRHRMHFVVGAMVHTLLNSAPLKEGAPGACDPADTDGTLKALVRFAAAGMRAPEDGTPLTHQVANAEG